MAYTPLDVFVGEVSEHLAHVYVRVPGDAAVTGVVRGPFNAFTQTLPTTTPIVDLGPGKERLGRAIIVDPCTWSPTSPSTYDVHAQTQNLPAPILHHDCFGIRRFGIQKQSFFLDGKRWVVRGVFEEGRSAELADFRQLGAALVLRSLNELPGQHEVLPQSTRLGVFVIVRLGEKTPSFPLRTIARYPSSPIVVLPSAARLTRQHRNEAPNLVFAQRLEDSLAPAEWADAVWLEFTEMDDFVCRIQGINIPIIAVRRYHGDSLAEARAAIDTLQADLAPIGQFAGYVV